MCVFLQWINLLSTFHFRTFALIVSIYHAIKMGNFYYTLFRLSTYMALFQYTTFVFTTAIDNFCMHFCMLLSRGVFNRMSWLINHHLNKDQTPSIEFIYFRFTLNRFRFISNVQHFKSTITYSYYIKADPKSNILGLKF